MAQYNPDAGRIVSYTESAVLTATSGEKLTAVIDNDSRTFWESGAPLPEGYISRPELNALHQENTHVVGGAFDGNLNTSQNFSKIDASGLYTWHYKFKKPVSPSLLSIKCQVKSPLIILLTDGLNKHNMGTYTVDENYRLKTIRSEKSELFTGITLQCSEPFDVFELAALAGLPFEAVMFDFGKMVPVGQVYSRHMSSENVIQSAIEISSDNKKWRKIADLQPQAVPFLPVVFDQEYQTRYLRLVHYLKPIDYAKAAIWELKVYDRHGPYGPPKPFMSQKETISERLGINGIWGWGYNTYSDNLPAGSGPYLYNKVARKARNYHELLWDIKSPAEQVDYQSMAAGNGTQVNWWLNWNREYATWQNAGFEVTASIMFQQKTVPSSVWINPFQNAYQYGLNFGRHFGKNAGNGLVRLVEAGNEPWDYEPGFYPVLLHGMAKGIKDGNPSMLVIPAAFQATFRQFEGHEENHYAGANITAESLPYLDGLNAHFYSHAFDTTGNRITVNPEDPRSGLHGIRNMIRFRDVNLPGKSLYITEYGFDSEGGSEECRFSECVTEEQQAAWGIRAALLLMRHGADEVYWYFFANEYTAPFLHTRAGLTGSINVGFNKKHSFHAFSKLMQILGNTRMERVLIESEQAYAYYFTDNNNQSYAVVWLPNNDHPGVQKQMMLSLPDSPKEFCYLDGNPALEWITLSDQSKKQVFNLKGYPMVIRF